ncbi:hypothetical protein DL98DRAFT_93645 [Cadophora sp. DSE1049]|nr:hypothetical protein DL98DRAFT_93645 [Cadophora sp. DSE1049]
MSIWSDQDSAAITNEISKLPPRSEEYSATLLTTANEKLCIGSTPANPSQSIPSLANSASSPGPEKISTQSRKRKRSDIEQDHLEQAQKRTHQQNKHLTAEHREEGHLVAAYLGTGRVEAGNTVADFQAEHFESRYHEEEYFGVEQPEPEYFKMDKDRASIAGSNRSLISNRPILKAKLPSRQSSRSTSPTRLTLALLRSAALPIDICQPGLAAAASPSKAVNKMKGFLLDGYDKTFISRQLEVCTFALFPIQSLLPLIGPTPRNRSGRSYCFARRNV